MDRKPNVAVRRELRREVGFGCPVPGCGSPYLSWHHFDPPWHIKHHNDPAGIVALCRTHHDQADVGAFSKEQLHEFKRRGARQNEEVRGKFNWMRYSLLSVVGGNFYYETPVVFEFFDEPIVWFNRDEEGYLLLNVRMLTLSGEPRYRCEIISG